MAFKPSPNNRWSISESGIPKAKQGWLFLFLLVIILSVHVAQEVLRAVRKDHSEVARVITITGGNNEIKEGADGRQASGSDREPDR